MATSRSRQDRIGPPPVAQTEGAAGGREQLLRRLEAEVRPSEGVVPAFIMADPDVYRLERETIFLRCWQLVGHESEISRPGDYVSRFMGEQPVILARGEDGGVRVFLNLCRHRGMRVCRSDLGNSSHFRCPYHGWTYKNTGELIGVPYQSDAYGDSPLNKEELGLLEARVGTYAGLIFATWDQDAPSLDEYLGDMRWYLDLIVGRAEMEVVGPPQRWMVRGNWKLAAENFASDAYHTMYTHASIQELGLVPRKNFAVEGYQIYAGNGHGLGLGMPAPTCIFPAEVQHEYRSRLSPEQFEVLQVTKNLHATVFPNLSFLISAARLGEQMVSHTTMRLWLPRGADRMEIYSWFLVERGASEDWKRRSKQAYVFTFGASGTFEQDDTENWTDITANSTGPVASRHVAYQYLSGLHRKPAADFPGPGRAYQGKYCEENARGFYSTWLRYVLEGNGSWRE